MILFGIIKFDTTLIIGNFSSPIDWYYASELLIKLDHLFKGIFCKQLTFFLRLESNLDSSCTICVPHARLYVLLHSFHIVWTFTFRKNPKVCDSFFLECITQRHEEVKVQANEEQGKYCEHTQSPLCLQLGPPFEELSKFLLNTDLQFFTGMWRRH